MEVVREQHLVMFYLLAHSKQTTYHLRNQTIMSKRSKGFILYLVMVTSEHLKRLGREKKSSTWTSQHFLPSIPGETDAPTHSQTFQQKPSNQYLSDWEVRPKLLMHQTSQKRCKPLQISKSHGSKFNISRILRNSHPSINESNVYGNKQQ